MNFCLIGFPLGHSVSPFIHKMLFDISGVDADYKNVETAQDALNITELAKEYDGFNVTIPYKTQVIPYLDGLCGKAKYLKTVNTVKNDNGRLYGYNTDADGFLKSLELSGIELEGRVLVCGAGGAARMMAIIAAKSGCTVTVIEVPSAMDKAYALANDIFEQFGKMPQVFESGKVCGEFDLLLNATPCGMYPDLTDITPVNEDIISRTGAVFDAVYNPQKTKLIKIAKAHGAKAAYGLPMLVYQAAKAQSIWYGADFSDDRLLYVVEKTAKHITETFS